MVASCIKISKAFADLQFFKGTYERLLLLGDHFLRLDNQYVAGDVVSSTSKFKIHGSEFNFVSIFWKT